MKKVVLLNPPGKRLYVREYYCSKVSQADNLLHPIDLVMLSGILAREYEVSLIDAIADRIPAAEVLRRLKETAPFAVVCLVGSVSLEEDLAWIATMRSALPETRILGSGDVFVEDGERYMRENAGLDAILLSFINEDVLGYLRGDVDGLAGMIVRTADGGIRACPRKAGDGRFEVPVPRHELFQQYRYRHSLIRGDKFATTLIDYGCPFPCTFCIMNTLGYRFRPVENVLAELRHIRELGIPEVFFHTQTFGAHRETARALCEAMIAEDFGFGWVCFSRVDVTTPDFLDLMKRAGCHGIIYGIESASDRILKQYRKHYTVAQVMQTIDHCSRIGIETSGTFILGLPEEDETTINETIRLLKRIRLDYAGINVAVPRVGTELRREAIESGLICHDCRVMDQSGTTISMATRHLSRKDLEKYRRKAIFTFYFRPSYILRRLRKVRPGDFVKLVRGMLGLIRTTWMR